MPPFPSGVRKTCAVLATAGLLLSGASAPVLAAAPAIDSPILPTGSSLLTEPSAPAVPERAEVPAPQSAVILGLGLIGLCFFVRRRFRP